MIVAAFEAVVTIHGAGVAPALVAEVTYAPSSVPILAVSVDPTATQASLPRSLAPGRAQVVGIAVYLDGEPIPLSARRPAAEVVLSTGARNRWSLSLPHPGAFGAVAAYLGPAPGNRRIDIRGLYLTPGGLVEVPLVTNGKVDNSDLIQGPDGSWTEQVTGLDASARYDHRLVTVNLPLGHGQTLGAIARTAAAQAGVPAMDIEDGPALLKPVAFVNQDLFSALSAPMAAFGRSLYVDRNGTLVNPVTEYRADSRVDFVLRDRDLVMGQTKRSAKGDVYTRITLTGTMPVPQDDSLHVTVTTVVDVGDYSPKTAASIQNADGSLSALGISPPAPFRTEISRVETRRTFRGDTLVFEEIREWGWWNPEVARYYPAEDLVSLAFVSGAPYNVFLYGGASPGDQQSAYHLQQELYALVNHSQQTWHYDRGLGSGDTGVLLSTVTVKDMPSFRGAAIKHRDSVGTTWESLGYIPGRLILGSGRGVDNGGATPGLESLPLNTPATGNSPFAALIVPKERVTVTYAPRLGYLDGQVTVTEQLIPAAAGASLYLFANGTRPEPGSAEFEVLAESAREAISYSAQGESSHSQATVNSRRGVFDSSQISDGLDGYLPRAETDAVAAGGVSQAQSQPMEAQYISYALEGTHDRAEYLGSSTWEETPEQLQDSARRTLVEDAALTVEVAIPASFYVGPLWQVSLELACVDLLGYGFGIPIVLRRPTITHSIAEGGPALTKISGRHYLVAA